MSGASDMVIRVEGLSKQYRLGEIGTGTLAHDINRWWHRVRGKENPYQKIVEHRPAGGAAAGKDDGDADGHADYVWSLRDIGFTVRRGEVLGIIGKNGAGKSTLLKILSRVTAPTTGRIRVRGRIASLLEVGTGFHPELSGRENVYLNGAILGMRRHEIDRKFPEIVAFAGVDRYIDTPVKRYSSGMYVRLAFAVAAHLDPDILIVDEVLAVGDAAFQRKCLGKMNQFRGSGRTILFVSHNMQAVRQLCQRVVWLEGGRIREVGPADEVMNRYLSEQKESRSLHDLNAELAAAPHDPAVRVLDVDIRQDGESRVELLSGKPVHIVITWDVHQDTEGLHLYFLLCDLDGTLIFDSLHNGDAPESLPLVRRGRYVSTAEIPADFLAGRTYELQIQAGIHAVRAVYHPPPAIRFTVTNAGLVNRAYPGYDTPGKVAPLIPWRTERLSAPTPAPE